MALVLDTGVIYAALNSNDPDHQSCASLIEGAEEQLVIPQPVLVEVDYWVRKHASVDVWLAFCQDIHAGAYTPWPADATLTLAAAEVQSRFSDQDLGFVDSAVFETCQALGEQKVATLDHRHFGVLRTANGKSLELLPAS
jgi:uncharacterized protein